MLNLAFTLYAADQTCVPVVVAYARATTFSPGILDTRPLRLNTERLAARQSSPVPPISPHYRCGVGLNERGNLPYLRRQLSEDPIQKGSARLVEGRNGWLALDRRRSPTFGL